MSAETMVEHLSYQNCKRNRPSMRHQFQDTVEEIAVRQAEAGVFGEPERHQFLRRCDIEGAASDEYFPYNINIWDSFNQTIQFACLIDNSCE